MSLREVYVWVIFSGCILVSPWARAETFALKNGELLEGTVVRMIGNTISIRLDNRGMHQCPLSDLDWVALTNSQGLVTQGTLKGWSDGTYFLGTDQGRIAFKDGKIMQIIKQEAPPPEPQPVISRLNAVM